jgi:hypothetical protein
LEQCRINFQNAADSVSQIFDRHASRFIAKEKFETLPLPGDKGEGAVYVYFDADGRALYVGETSRRVKARMHDQTSPHKATVWWPKWQSMRFLTMMSKSDRLVMEMLLIAAMNPEFNVKPGKIDPSNLFASVGDVVMSVGSKGWADVSPCASTGAVA